MHTSVCTVCGLWYRSLFTILWMSTRPCFSTCFNTISIVMNVPVRPTPALLVCIKLQKYFKIDNQTCNGRSLVQQNCDEYLELFDGMLKYLYHNLVLHDQAKQ